MRNGTKIEANANRYTFIWAKAVKKQLEKLDVRISKEVPEIALRYSSLRKPHLTTAFHIL